MRLWREVWMGHSIRVKYITASVSLLVELD